ncbi:MAG: T9SS type A sorting domain-containing protein [Flavobacteriaceae bacterium]
MKKIYFLLVAILVTNLSFAQGNEDFTNLAAGNSYSDGSFTGNNSITWTYTASRDAIENDGGLPVAGQMPALMLRRVSSNSALVSSTISGGIGDFSVKLYKQFTGGGDRQVELFVNGVSKGTSTGFDDYNEHVFSVTGINVGGDITIELKNISAKQVAIDDITWTAFAGAAMPAMSINSPSEGEVLNSGDVTVTYGISNFNVATAGMGDGHFHYELTGPTAIASTPVYSNTGSFDMNGLMPGDYTLFMDLRDDAHASLNPAVEATINFTVRAFTTVADIAALRAGTTGDGYELTGEALINYEQSFRHQKWIQDATAGILIDDNAGNITAGVRGDGLSGIKGVLGEYQGMLQFIPAMDATLVSPSTVTITPEEVTFADLNANPNDYEAELVKVVGVLLADTAGGDGNFANGNQYPMTQGSDNLDFRTNFYGVDYITTALPTTAQDIVGLIGERSSGYFFAARDLADFLTVNALENNAIKGFVMYPNPVNNGTLNITTLNNLDKNIQIFNILGKQVLATTITGTTVNVADLNAGIYLIRVEEAGSFTTRKLMIK